MIDALLAISADPFQALMSAVFLFAVSLYPVGLMLGSTCSRCCQQNPCPQCADGLLPDTVTVTFSGLQDQARSDDLIQATVSACFGSGGSARVLEPGGDPETNSGPISSVLLTSQGSGYALLARVEPEVLVASAGNDDATLSLVLSETLDQCDVPTWSVSSVEVTSAGTGYEYGEPVSFIANLGSVQAEAGSGTILTRLEEPTLAISAMPGEGAVFEPTFSAAPFDPGKYSIESISVSNGGTGYEDGTNLIIEVLGTSVEEFAASAVIATQRQEPGPFALTAGINSNASGYDLVPVVSELTDFRGSRYWAITGVTINNPGTGWVFGERILVQPASHTEREAFFGIANASNEEPTLEVVPISGSGSGAVLSASLTQTFLPDGSLAWSVDSVAVTSAGSGYLASDTTQVVLSVGTELAPLIASLEVNEAGEITGVSIQDGGAFAVIGVLQSVILFNPGYYFVDTGVIESVRVDFGGVYYNDTGEIDRIDIINGGKFFKEDPTLPPYVADVTLHLLQTLPSNGTGAVIQGQVDSTVGSPTFGQIIGLTITNGGDGYLAWRLRNSLCCGDYYNGKSVVLRRNTFGFPCVYTHTFCGPSMEDPPGTPPRGSYGRGRTIVTLEYRGPTQLATLTLDDIGRTCNAVLTATSNVSDCSAFALQLTNATGVTADVVPGGDYESTFLNPGGDACYICCKGEEPFASQAEFTLTDGRGRSKNWSGTYVLRFRQSQQESFRGWRESFLHPSGIGIIQILVHLQPCGFPSPDGWAPGGCDQCHKQCVFYAQIGVSDFGTAPDNYLSESFLVPDLCTQCEDTPICNPFGRAWVMCRGPSALPSCGEMVLTS